MIAPLSEGDEDAPNRPPDTAPSALMYAIAFASSSSRKCSTHSVEPMMPYSSASQCAIMIERRGRHASSRASAPSASARVRSMAVPPLGSIAPNPQGS